jgi:multiple sugar transport system substrate-binding protein
MRPLKNILKGGFKMRKKIMLIALVVLFLFSFTIAFAGPKEKKAKITFMAALYSEATTPFWEDVIAAFEKEYPNVEVELDVVHWDNVYQKTTTLISAKQEPDVLNTDTIMVQYAADELLEPLDGYMDASFKDKFIPAMLSSGVYDGKTQALPFLASVRALFYNKDVFEKHRVKPPRTAEELVEVGLEINDPPDFYAFGMPLTNFEGQAYISYFLWAAGGRWVDETRKCVVNSPEGLEALNFAKDLVHKYKIVYPPWSTVNRDETQKVMTAGKIGMLMTASFFPAIAKGENPDLRLGAVPIPAYKEQYNLGVVDSLMIFKRSEHKQEAFDFIKFYFKDEWHKRACIEEGVLPVTKSVSNALKSDPDLGPFIEMLPNARFYPLHPKWQPMYMEVIKAWQVAILGEKDPKQALDDAVEKINTEIIK